MNNMSDGKSNGIVIMYLKDGVIYPVALNKEQLEMLDLSIGVCFQGTLNVVNKPIGEAKILEKNS